MDISMYPINNFTGFAEICVKSQKTEMIPGGGDGGMIAFINCDDSSEKVKSKDCGETVDFSSMDPANRNCPRRRRRRRKR
jgi:hypothetical protein